MSRRRKNRKRRRYPAPGSLGWKAKNANDWRQYKRELAKRLKARLPIIKAEEEKLRQRREFAVVLRERSTVAEQILRDALIAAQISHLFQHSIGNWIVDFYFPIAKLIVELDGGYHDDPTQVAKDRFRERDLRERGYRIIRFRNHDIEVAVEAVVAAIRREMKPRLYQCGIPR